MRKHLLIFLSLSLGVNAQALKAGQEVRSIAATSPTYVFGEVMRLNESLNMAEYGPIRSAIKKCTNKVAFCLASDAVIIAAPRSCSYFSTKSTLMADGFTIRKIGLIKYNILGRSKNASNIILLSVDGRQDEIIGYSPKSGIIFVISDARNGAKLATDFAEASKKKNLQDTFNNKSTGLLKLSGQNKLFPCER